MDLQLRNSIYQCNPRCSIEKRNTKNHSAAAAPATTATPNPNANVNANANVTPATVSAMPTFMTTSRDRERDRPFRPHDYTSSLLNKIERDCTDKHELHRNNCLNETVSELLYLRWHIYNEKKTGETIREQFLYVVVVLCIKSVLGLTGRGVFNPKISIFKYGKQLK